MRPIALIALLMAVLLAPDAQVQADESKINSVPQAFQTDQLVAWCIVPFDATKRGPAERVEMLKRLGLRRVAYDWRQEQVQQFEDEILAYQQAEIEFFAFWSWHPSIEPLLIKHDVRPQVWEICPSPKAETQAQRVAAAAELLLPLVETTKRLGLPMGLYNHGKWGGQPENLVAVCKHLRQHHDADHVGIVYNFHHAHDRVGDFGESLKRMKPFLICLNLNGMIDPKQHDVTMQRNKIRPIGSGQYETQMIRQIIQSGYNGPIGILDHRHDLDTEVALKANLKGLAKLLSAPQH
ncbi:MAG: hypothetical protein AAGA03_15595 [Planctomycetota bacterium]